MPSIGCESYDSIPMLYLTGWGYAGRVTQVRWESRIIFSHLPSFLMIFDHRTIEVSFTSYLCSINLSHSNFLSFSLWKCSLIIIFDKFRLLPTTEDIQQFLYSNMMTRNVNVCTYVVPLWKYSWWWNRACWSILCSQVQAPSHTWIFPQNLKVQIRVLWTQCVRRYQAN